MSKRVDSLSSIAADQKRVQEFLDGLKAAHERSVRDAAETIALGLAVGYGVSAYQRYKNAKKAHR